jgi:UDP-N-acetylglucosamine:LPS N-acetylglucosamine transferase
MMMNADHPVVLLTLAGGGFQWQSLSVARDLETRYSIEIVSAEPREAFAGKGVPDVPYHLISRITIMEDRLWWHKARNLLLGLAESWRLVGKVRPAAIVCVATSMAVPLCLVGRLRGIPTVFVESITRVSKASATGRILSRLRLCDRLYVQWPEAVHLYPNAVFKGGVL